MPLAIRCPKCRKAYAANESLVGKRLSCHCGAQFQISPPRPVQQPSLGELLDDELRIESTKNVESPAIADHSTFLEIRFDPSVRREFEEMFRPRILKAVLQHLIKHGATRAPLTALSIAVDEVTVEGGELYRIRIAVRGKVLGLPVNRQIKTQRRINRGQGFGARLAMTMANAAMSLTEDEKIIVCLNESLADVCIAIDSGIGGESGVSQTFATAQWGRWGALAVATTYLLIVVASHGFDDVALRPLTLVGPFILICSFLFVHMLNHCWVPLTFFRDDPRGRKAMTRSGVRSPFAARVLAMILAVILGAVLLICLVALHVLIAEHVQKAEKERAKVRAGS